MANFLNYTTKTTVVFGGRAIDTASFSNALYVSIHNLFTPRQKSYASTDEMIADKFPAGHPAVKFASGVFSGKQPPNFLIIGRAAPLAYTVQVGTGWEEDDIISVNQSLNGVKTTVAHTVTTETTQQEVGDALAALIDDSGVTFTATSDANGLITIVPAAPTTPIAFGASGFTTVYTTTSETVDDVMAAIRAENDGFSTLSSESHLKADQANFSLYAEANDMLYVYSTSDVDVYDSGVADDIFSTLKGTQQQYTMGMFNERADIDFPEGAVLGSFLSLSPSYNFTMNLQDLVGITPSNLTVSQKAEIVENNGNYYELQYGVGAFAAGFTSNGDYLDRSRFGLWVKLRSQESMFRSMKNFSDQSSALAYSDAGIQIVKSNLYTDVINVAIRNGAAASGTSTDSAGKIVDLNPIVTTSTRASQTNAAIGQRLWEGFVLEIVYTGSIHHIDSKGYIINNRVAV